MSDLAFLRPGRGASPRNKIGLGLGLGLGLDPDPNPDPEDKPAIEGRL
jgi:hypothetical protein